MIGIPLKVACSFVTITGNVVTDAMVFKHLKYPDEASWANVTMAMVNGGGIRASIEPGKTCTI